MVFVKLWQFIRSIKSKDRNCGKVLFLFLLNILLRRYLLISMIYSRNCIFKSQPHWLKTRLSVGNLKDISSVFNKPVYPIWTARKKLKLSIQKRTNDKMALGDLQFKSYLSLCKMCVFINLAFIFIYHNQVMNECATKEFS